MEKIKTVSVLGAGAWGTTIAQLLAGNGLEVKLWALEKEVAEDINKKHINSKFLAGIKLSGNIKAASTLDAVLKDSQAIVSVVPTQHLRKVVLQAKDLLSPSVLILSASKGFERKTLSRPSEIIFETAGIKDIAALSGPNLSKEIASGLPAASVVACRNAEKAAIFQQLLSCKTFRVYTSGDVTGVETGGALKNIIAIAAGVADGLKLGNNAKSALLIRGIAEITRLGVALGGKAQTFSGLSGMGDLITTCESNLSRNHFVGEELAKGRHLQDILTSMTGIPEGVETAPAALELARKHNIELPITEEVHLVLFANKNPKDAIMTLMTRELKSE